MTALQPGQRGGSAASAISRKGNRQTITALVARADGRHKPGMSAPEIFDRTLRRRRRDRAAPDFAAHDFLHRFMAEGVAERLGMVARDFIDRLEIGSAVGLEHPPGARVARLDPGFHFGRTAGGVQADEDRLPFADAAFDLVASVGVLDSVSDLPGALLLARRVLRPDGLFVAAMLGAGSLATLRAVLADAEADRPALRLHPQIDVRAAGDLLVRAGFALPVADTETMQVRYRDLFTLIGDLRGMAATSVLHDREPLSRPAVARAAAAFAARADAEGRTTERFEIVYLTGWAADASQPRPARRGSATASLAAALAPPR